MQTATLVLIVIINRENMQLQRKWDTRYIKET